MRCLFVSDTHGALHLEKAREALKQAELGPRDAVVHCGDFGAPWAAETDEALNWWRGLGLRVLICPGNHENHAWIARQPPARRYGCKGRDLGGGLFAPRAGAVARLGGRRLWFYPGGYSIDHALRVPGRTLFAEELLPRAEAERILDRFLSGPGADILVTHDGPRSFVMEHFGIPLREPGAAYYAKLGLPADSRSHPAFLLDALLKRQDLFRLWVFGHHHRDFAAGKLRCLWKQPLLLDLKTGRELPLPPGEGGGQAMQEPVL